MQSSAEQCRAVQSSAEQCRAVQSSAEQCRAVQSSAEQCRAVQSFRCCWDLRICLKKGDLGGGLLRILFVVFRHGLSQLSTAGGIRDTVNDGEQRQTEITGDTWANLIRLAALA